MAEKTPEEMARKAVNKRVGDALADIEIERRKLNAKIKKLEKREKKILSGEIVPDKKGKIEDDDDEDNDSSSIKVNFLLDESSSMGSCIDQTITGFNEYIKALKKEKKNVKFTLTTFGGHNVNMIYKNKNINDVKELSIENYHPGGMTPLYDAIGGTIDGSRKDGKTLFVIMTDGEENASQEYGLDAITKLIKGKEKVGWTFVYLGADQNAWQHSRTLGLTKMNTMSFDSKETRGAYDKLIGASSLYMCSNKKVSKNFFGKK